MSRLVQSIGAPFDLHQVTTTRGVLARIAGLPPLGNREIVSRCRENRRDHQRPKPFATGALYPGPAACGLSM
jgi:hypothetical protein